MPIYYLGLWLFILDIPLVIFSKLQSIMLLNKCLTKNLLAIDALDKVTGPYWHWRKGPRFSVYE